VNAIWSPDGPKWTLRLRQHPEDSVVGTGQRKTLDAGRLQVGLLMRECVVELPLGTADPHPDVEALAARVITRPWTERRRLLRRRVPREFAPMADKLFRLEVGPVDEGLAPVQRAERRCCRSACGLDRR
jgi:hypothetical protein